MLLLLLPKSKVKIVVATHAMLIFLQGSSYNNFIIRSTEIAVRHCFANKLKQTPLQNIKIKPQLRTQAKPLVQK